MFFLNPPSKSKTKCEDPHQVPDRQMVMKHTIAFSETEKNALNIVGTESCKRIHHPFRTVREHCRDLIKDRVSSHTHTIFLFERDEVMIRNVTENFERLKKIHRRELEELEAVRKVVDHSVFSPREKEEKTACVDLDLLNRERKRLERETRKEDKIRELKSTSGSGPGGNVLFTSISVNHARASKCSDKTFNKTLDSGSKPNWSQPTGGSTTDERPRESTGRLGMNEKTRGNEKKHVFSGVFSVEDLVFELVTKNSFQLNKPSLRCSLKKEQLEREIHHYTFAFLGELRLCNSRCNNRRRMNRSFCFWKGTYVGDLRCFLKYLRVGDYPYTLEIYAKVHGTDNGEMILDSIMKDREKIFSVDENGVRSFREEEHDRLYDLALSSDKKTTELWGWW